jgi:hypothetical protein
MDAFSREQVDRFVEDIAYVKKAIQKNTSVLQQMDFRKSLRLTILLSAIGTFFFCGLFHIVEGRFGSFAAIPIAIKATLFSAMALVFILIGLVKNSGIMKSAHSIDPGISLGRLLREYYTIRVYHNFVPLILVLFFSVGYAVTTGNLQLIIPMAAIGAGLVYNGLGTLLRVDEFFWTAYWLIVTGVIVLVYHAISPLLAISLTAGGSLLLLAVALYIPQKKQQEV